jgi:phospholipid/cholesterol/gamma-HCH transport system ATP-binding protein
MQVKDSVASAAALEVQAVYKSFGTHEVLSGVELSVEKGRSLVLLGRSGSGKSVLLKCLLGLLPINKGVLRMEGRQINGETAAEQEARLRQLGMVFQSSALFDSLPVWQNIAFGVSQSKQQSNKHAKQAARAIAEEMLHAVGLEESVLDLYPAELSGGMQRRVALARAIALRPPYLFFDEPTAGLDPIFSALISGLIRDRIRALGATALTITHDLKCAATVADEIAMLHEGKIVWTGEVTDLETTDHPVVRQFVDARPDVTA